MPDKRKATMPTPSSKRPRISYGEDEDDGEPSVAPLERPSNNPFYGQKGAFPGLDDGGDELLYGPRKMDSNICAWSGISEANSLPGLFSGPVKATNLPESPSNVQVDAKPPKAPDTPLPEVFLVDDAYIAPVEDLNKNKLAHSSLKLDEIYPEMQTSYYGLLRHRFLLLRSTLRCSPPADAINALDNDHPISLPRNAGSAHKAWRRLLVTVDPQMVQLACMDMESVLAVLEILARMVSDVVRSEDAQRVRRIGVWAWGLLGKCWEVGQLSSQEVGIIRNLGKRATTILHKVQELEKQFEEEADWSESDSLEDHQQRTPVEKEAETEGDAQPESTAQYSEETKQEVPPEPTARGEKDTTQEAVSESVEAPDSSMPDASVEPSELEAAKARLQAQLQNNPDSIQTSANSDYEDYEGYNDYEELTKQTHALLDMIITVVGEFFGQRDLLEARDVWI
ncbi:hypothetical protein N7457_008945 [Penicillium paradoxum]|uniref:uncharacterized protein n=1 Tax=Penicillium paradoxum TaxID=176176 RepID=UPI002546BE0B|nr:uncharacterized protein N7457_008945 [Penicillium paradoxum]KAJ5774049.1 hypothetical protein N7457_008945 [Penicillium paradoxum]